VAAGSHLTKKKNRQVLLALTISKERNMLVAKKYLSGWVRIYGRRTVTTDGRNGYTQHADS
jgi:putative transposase